MKRRCRIETAERQRRVDAAVRHAVRVTRGSDAVGPVIFRPNLTSPSEPTRPATSAMSGSATTPTSSALAEALRDALGIPQVVPPKLETTLTPRGATKKPTSASKVRKEKNLPKLTPPKPKSAKSTKKPTSGTAPPKSGKRRKKKEPPPLRAQPAVRQLAEMSTEERRLAANANAAARLAFNARQRAAVGPSDNSDSPFSDLKRRWHREFSYIQRFQDSNPDATDLAAARGRLMAVEAEWQRLSTLAPNHPDYFPWPTTESPKGAGNIAAVDWEELGMLAYLGYHVGVTSKLTTAQRQRLLAHVFTMQLPPLNNVAYMQSWGSAHTGPRLRKMAEAIAAFARNAKRRSNLRFNVAIRHWEDDLSYLRKTFYRGRFDGFAWPTT